MIITCQENNPSSLSYALVVNSKEGLSEFVAFRACLVYPENWNGLRLYCVSHATMVAISTICVYKLVS